MTRGMALINSHLAKVLPMKFYVQFCKVKGMNILDKHLKTISNRIRTLMF